MKTKTTVRKLVRGISAMSLLIVAGISCSSSPQTLRLAAVPEPANSSQAVRLVWVGHGSAFRYHGQQKTWQRSPEHDYDFSVVQNRLNGRWESIKSMHRNHKNYDGSAGPRDQTLFFRIGSFIKKKQTVSLRVQSSMGPGAGTTDPEFRRWQIDLAPQISRFAPFNRFRLTQQYVYEKGRLSETVYLYKQMPDGSEKPFVRIQEEARIFIQRPLPGAPTRMR